MFGVRGAQWATAKRTRTATARRPSRGLSGRPALPLQTHDESLVAGVKPTPWTLPPRFIYAERSPKRNAPSEAITIWLKNRRRQGEYKHDMRVIDGLDRIMKRYAPVPPAERVEGYKFLNAFTLAPPEKCVAGRRSRTWRLALDDVGKVLGIDRDEAREILREAGIRIPPGRKPRRN
jgi:hypothetical protein